MLSKAAHSDGTGLSAGTSAGGRGFPAGDWCGEGACQPENRQPRSPAMARYFSARWKDAQAAAEAAEVAAPAAAAASAVARAASRVIGVIPGSERTLDLDLEVRLTLPAKKEDLTQPLILLTGAEATRRRLFYDVDCWAPLSRRGTDLEFLTRKFGQFVWAPQLGDNRQDPGFVVRSETGPWKSRKWGTVQEYLETTKTTPQHRSLKGMLALEGKITQNKALHKLLLETHPHKLVNVGSTDPEWGAGSAGCAGKNLLGELLMQLRQTLVDAASRPRPATAWRLVVDENTPQQSNVHDCGVSCTRVSLHVLSGWRFNWTAEHLEPWRMKIAFAILRRLKVVEGSCIVRSVAMQGA